LVGIALKAQGVPDRPLHMRINPLNILADQARWTPEIRSLHLLAVRLGLVFVGAALFGLALGVVGAPR
jgi:hypothetical protein